MPDLSIRLQIYSLQIIQCTYSDLVVPVVPDAFFIVALNMSWISVENMISIVPPPKTTSSFDLTFHAVRAQQMRSLDMPAC